MSVALAMLLIQLQSAVELHFFRVCLKTADYRRSQQITTDHHISA